MPHGAFTAARPEILLVLHRFAVRNREPLSAAKIGRTLAREKATLMRQGDLRSGKTSRSSGLDALARRYTAPLRRYFERRARHREDVPDLVQDTLTQMARLGDLSSIEKPEHYLFTTASNTLRMQARRDEVRHRGEHVPFEPAVHEGSDFSPEHILQNRQALAALQTALRDLPERTRSVFVLRAFEQQKTADVARALGISTRAVEGHYARALAHLALALRDYRDV